MKAYLIDPFTKTVTEVDYNGKFEQAYKLMDCSMIQFVGLDGKHTIMLDEEGLYKTNQKSFTVAGCPFVNRALIVGGKAANKDATKTLDEVKALVRF